MTLHADTAVIAGVLLLSLITVESGGLFMSKVVRGIAPANALQTSFFRAGHAHAGVLLVLSLAILGLIDAAVLPAPLLWFAKVGVPAAAILMPAGFFLSVRGSDPTKPNRLIVLVWIGGIVLALGLLTAAVGLIIGGATGF